ncbi:hypothetical protein GPX89_01690 [Nocardia sp. ET3-3]|uniref:RNA polymerase sigma factor 70 region 4 type 2 domain-containing protein n=1 Tax=Nocardia terrae TaxID=2675851 RepID=A0A7K1UNN3_9NOCA|nr:sigma factor-like helix-turn-helix DNA-binding protein [Nocardia terrae]MVU75952.1 hypothetical protein [Nocardia terrae]
MPVDSPTLPRTCAEPASVATRPPAIPGLDILTAAAAGRRTALAAVLDYTHRFVTSYCRATLGPDPASDQLAAQLSTTITTGWPAARSAGRDFLEFAYSSALRAVRLCRYELPEPQFLGPLTDRQREVLTLRVPVGLSPLETAVALDIPVRTVHRETRRAFAALGTRPPLDRVA